MNLVSQIQTQVSTELQNTEVKLHLMDKNKKKPPEPINYWNYERLTTPIRKDF